MAIGMPPSTYGRLIRPGNCCSRNDLLTLNCIPGYGMSVLRDM